MRFKTIAVATALSTLLWGASAGAAFTAYTVVKHVPHLNILETVTALVERNILSLHVAAHSLAVTPSQLMIGDRS